MSRTSTYRGIVLKGIIFNILKGGHKYHFQRKPGRRTLCATHTHTHTHTHRVSSIRRLAQDRFPNEYVLSTPRIH